MTEKLSVGSVVIFNPSDRTLGHIDLHTKYGPQVGHAYRVASIIDEGVLYLENGFGPYLDLDVEFVNSPTLVQVEVPLAAPPLTELLEESGKKVPNFAIGEWVIFTPAWATEKVASKVNWPITGRAYKIEAVEDNGLYIRLAGLQQAFPSWHFKKTER